MSSSFVFRMRRLWRHFGGVIWRGALFSVVFTCVLLAMRMGVGFSERAGIYNQGTLTHVYYTLGLFVLGGLDLGIPAGGPSWARGLLWFGYFAAPTITAAGVIEGLLRTISPARWKLRRLHNHIIIVGCGRVGRVYLAKLREEHPRRPVVVVELRADHPAAVEVSDVLRAIFVPGDIRNDALLDILGLDRAARIILVTGDDFVNLDTAAKMLARMDPDSPTQIMVHVANLHLRHVIENTHVARRCEIFNIYELAAKALVDTELDRHFHNTEGSDVVVVAGFGRFGQSLLHQLQERAAGKFNRVIILDFEAEKKVARFTRQVGFHDFYRREVVEGDLRDPRVWQSVEGLREDRPVFILGSGDDEVNSSTALWAKSEFPDALVVARSFYASSFVRDVSREAGFITFSIADLVAGSMPDRWFDRG